MLGKALDSSVATQHYAIMDNPYFVECDAQEIETREPGAKSVKRHVLDDLQLIAGSRKPANMAMLEIGCRAGLMTRHLAEVFGHVHGVDASKKMIRRSAEHLDGIRNTRTSHFNGRDLDLFAYETMDFVFAHTAFLELPTREAALAAIREAARVLRTGGTLKYQVQGACKALYRAPDQEWPGAVVTDTDVQRLNTELGLTLLARSGNTTQHVWYTVQKN